MSKTKKFHILNIAVVVCFVIVTPLFLSGCIDETPNLPNFVVVSKENSEVIHSLVKTAYVTIVIENIGANGTRSVVVSVNRGSECYTREVDLYLDNKEIRTLTFEFGEIRDCDLDSWTSEVQFLGED